MKVILLFLLIATNVQAQINGPDVVPVHSLASLSTDNQADTYIWLATPFETTYVAQSPDPKVIQFTGTPGQHTIILVTIKDKVQTQYRKTITFDNSPAPIPTPTPTPTDPIIKLGKQFGKELRITFAASILNSIDEIEKGSPISVARTNHTNRWKVARDNAFNKKFVPILDAISLTDSPTLEQRRQYCETLTKIAIGVGHE